MRVLWNMAMLWKDCQSGLSLRLHMRWGPYCRPVLARPSGRRIEMSHKPHTYIWCGPSSGSSNRVRDCFTVDTHPQTHKPKQVAAVKGINELRTDQLLEKILDLVTPKAEQRGTERPRVCYWSTVVCYECGQAGHIKRFCVGRGNGSGGADGGKPYNYGASASMASNKTPASTYAQTSAAPDARTSAPQDTKPTVWKSASAPAAQGKNSFQNDIVGAIAGLGFKCLSGSCLILRYLYFDYK